MNNTCIIFQQVSTPIKLITKFCIIDKWSSPTVSGQCPLPSGNFETLAISKNKSILFGGCRGDCCINHIYIAEMRKDTVVCHI